MDLMPREEEPRSHLESDTKSEVLPRVRGEAPLGVYWGPGGASAALLTLGSWGT